jgi:aminoglycoside phosphotransferase
VVKKSRPLTVPSSQPPVPALVGRLDGDGSVHAVWVTEQGGVTFRIGSDIPGTTGGEFIKVANTNAADFAGAARRLRWASHHLPVPRVLGFGSPNTPIDDDGRCCGHVDFGDLGVADRWADLAVAALSLGWNYPGRAWDAEFFAAHGIASDPMRMDYYRRLRQASEQTPDDTSR